MTTMSKHKYNVSAPKTPGSAHSITHATTLADARKIAKQFSSRADLKRQDVRIERADGTLVEYAGPAR